MAKKTTTTWKNRFTMRAHSLTSGLEGGQERGERGTYTPPRAGRGDCPSRPPVWPGSSGRRRGGRRRLARARRRRGRLTRGGRLGGGRRRRLSRRGLAH